MLKNIFNNSSFNNPRKIIISSIMILSGVLSVNSLFGYKLILVNESGQDVVFKCSDNGPMLVLKGGSFMTKGFWGSYVGALDRFAALKGIALNISKHDRLYYDRGFLSKTFGVTPSWTEIMRHFVEKPATQDIGKTVKDIASLDSTSSDTFVVIRFLDKGYNVTFIDKDGKAIRFKCVNLHNFLGLYTGSIWYEMEEFKLPRATMEIYSDLVDSVGDIVQSVKDGRVLPLTKFIEEFNKNNDFMSLIGGKIKFNNELLHAYNNFKSEAAGQVKKEPSMGLNEQEILELNRYGKGKDAGFKRIDTGFKPGVGSEKYKSAKK